MIIEKFYVNKLHGFRDISINFHNDLNFIIGVNGNYKTSCLKLIDDLISLNIASIMKTELNSCGIDIKLNEETRICISVKTSEESASLSISKKEQNYADDVLFKFEKTPSTVVFLAYSDSARNKKIDTDLLRSLTKEFEHKPILQKIFEYIEDCKPIFLSIERNVFRKKIEHQTNELIIESRAKLSDASLNDIHNKIESLSALNTIVIKLSTQHRRYEERELRKLRAELLKTVLMPPQIESFNLNLSEIKDRINQPEIRTILEKISLDNQEIINSFDRFRTTLEDKNASDAVLYVLAYQASQINTLINLINQHNLKLQANRAALISFEKAVNSFFNLSSKRLKINSIGSMLIELNNFKRHPHGLEYLSSGEKHLLLIIANLMFANSGKNKRPIIIDEPEVSLHISWQEKLSQEIKLLNNSSQIIIATHSPDIVGEHREKILEISNDI